MEANNNSRIKCFGSYVPVTNITCIDEKQNIWKGDRVIEVATSPEAMLVIFFTREPSEIDNLIKEKTIYDDSVLGFPFTLIPKEKILFGYDPPSMIIKPKATTKQSPFRDY